MGTFEAVVIALLAAIAAISIGLGGTLHDIRDLLRGISDATEKTAESARNIEESANEIQLSLEPGELVD